MPVQQFLYTKIENKFLLTKKMTKLFNQLNIRKLVQKKYNF